MVTQIHTLDPPHRFHPHTGIREGLRNKPATTVQRNITEKGKEQLPQRARKMSKKGFYEMLIFICEKGFVHYADILDYNLSNRIVQSRATVTLIIRNLTRLGLIKRIVVDPRPIRTIYQPTNKGQELLKHLDAIERL